MSKYVISNKSGSAGKTTTAANLVFPHVPDALVFALDNAHTVAELGIHCTQYDPLQFKEMFEKIFAIENAIVDVGGAKLFDEFLLKLTEAKQAHHEFDYFLVPAKPDDKSETDAIYVVGKYLEAGIPASKIRVIYNAVDSLSKFTMLPGLVKLHGIKTAKIPKSDVYPILAALRKTVKAVLADPLSASDYKGIVLASDPDSDEYKQAFNNYYAKGMVELADTQLKAAWAELDI